jgi:hypothetical protein
MMGGHLQILLNSLEHCKDVLIQGGEHRLCSRIGLGRVHNHPMELHITLLASDYPEME